MELLELYSVEMAIDLARRLKVIDHLSHWRSVNDLGRLLSFQRSFKFALHWILERLVEIDCVEARTEGGTRIYHLRHTPKSPNLENLRAAGLAILSRKRGDLGFTGSRRVPLIRRSLMANKAVTAICSVPKVHRYG